MSTVSLQLAQRIRTIRASPYYIAKNNYISQLTFVQSVSAGDICISTTNDDSSPQVFEIFGEVERDSSFCTPHGSYDPERAGGAFEGEDIHKMRFKGTVREPVNPRIQEHLDDDWCKIPDNMAAIHRRAFAADPTKMPASRICAARNHKVVLQHNFVVVSFNHTIPSIISLTLLPASPGS